jgi:hypothetical protein
MNLDGLDDPWCSMTCAVTNNNPTGLDWELLQMKSNPSWWSRVIWIKDGMPIDNPFF